LNRAILKPSSREPGPIQNGRNQTRQTRQTRSPSVLTLRRLGDVRHWDGRCGFDTGRCGVRDAMKPPRVRWNTTEARVERFVRLAQRLELPVYGFEVRGRDVTVLTHPREAGPPVPSTEPDPVGRWFRDNAAADDLQNERPGKKQ
jgi:hypothetical protein